MQGESEEERGERGLMRMGGTYSQAVDFLCYDGV